MDTAVAVLDTGAAMLRCCWRTFLKGLRIRIRIVVVPAQYVLPFGILITNMLSQSCVCVYARSVTEGQSRVIVPM